MRSALIEDGVVINIIEIPEGGLPQEWAPGLIAHPLSDDAPAGIGWIYDANTEELSEPEEPAPAPPSEEELLNQARDEVARMSVLDRVGANNISNEKAKVLSPLFPKLDLDGVAVEAGDVYRWDDTLVQVIQSHTTQLDWPPETTPALFKLYRNVLAGPQPWVEPTGAHDAYSIGDQVRFKGATYESLIDANTWDPSAYPAGWKLIS